MRALVAGLCLLVAGRAQAQTRVLDSFEDLSPWRAQPSDGVSASIHPDQGVSGRAMRIDVDFHGGAGYAVVHRSLPTTLPDDYTITFRVRGSVPPNNIEFKMIDSTGENVWWVNRRDFVFGRTWQTVTIRKRHVSFAWGPSGGGDLKRFAALEIAITAGKGGRGSVWLDELTLTTRPATTALARPIVMTDPAIGNANAIVDNDTLTSWWPSRPAQSVTLDFGAMRELGGIIVRWEPDRQAADYDVELQREDSAWTTGYRVRDSNGGDDFIPLPDQDARRLRLRILRPANPNGIALREVVVQPLSWSATPNAFAEVVAANAPRGAYPRYLSREQSYWTIIGVSGDRARPLLSEDGTLDPFRGGFSLEPFIHDGSRLLTWADAKTTQSLADGDLPIPSVHREHEHLTLDVTAFVDGAPRSAVAWARYRVTNRDSAARAVTLFLGVRPFQVNPSWQFLTVQGGVAPIDSIRKSGGVVVVNGKRVVPLSRAAAFGASTFDAGGIIDWLRRDTVPARPSARDAGGRASGALSFPLALAPNGFRDVWIAVPLDTRSPPLAPAASAAAAGRSGEAALARSASAWRASLDRTRIDLGGDGTEYAATLRTALAHILVNRDGAAIRPGARSYARSWIRDGSMISTALLELGHAPEVRQYIDWYSNYQFPNGKIPCCVDARGADPVPEHDSHGEFIHLVTQYLQFSGDTSFARQMWPKAAAAAAYIDTLRRQDLTPAFDTGSARMFRGILPPSISHEGYSAKPMHSYWDDFWALTGLKDASALAGALGDTAEQARFVVMADSLRGSILETITLSMRAHRIDFIPGSADLGDFDATSTTIALAPGGELSRLPRAAVDATWARYWSQVVARRDSAKGNDYTPYEWRNVGALVRLGQKQRALAVAATLMNDRRPAAWHQWGEVVYRDPRHPGFIGDMPHTWVASDFIRSVIDMIAYEREDGALVIGAGIPELWANLSPGVRVSGLHTSSGTIDLTMKGGGRRVSVHVGGTMRVPAAGIEVHSPYDTPILTATVNGKPVTTDGRSIVIHSLPADIAFGH
ncbi:MAG: discoidin domain-containing protein [Gemmatimonadaceae bacterium]